MRSAFLIYTARFELSSSSLVSRIQEPEVSERLQSSRSLPVFCRSLHGIVSHCNCRRWSLTTSCNAWRSTVPASVSCLLTWLQLCSIMGEYGDRPDIWYPPLPPMFQCVLASIFTRTHQSSTVSYRSPVDISRLTSWISALLCSWWPLTTEFAPR